MSESYIHRDSSLCKLASVFLAFGVVFFSLQGCGERRNADSARKRKAVAVTVAKPVTRKIVEWDEHTGRFSAVESVEVRARVSGYIQSIHFREGAMVNKGDLLFVIDPRPFEAALEQAEGEERRAEAQQHLAITKMERKRALLQEKAVSQEDFDERMTEARQAAGQLQAAKGAVAAARLNLKFTQVRSPVKGRIGRILVTVGNLITGGAGNATLLTRIVSLDPIYFLFDVDERTYQKYVRLVRRDKGGTFRATLRPVYAKLATEETFGHKGRLDFVDSLIDPNTGTILMRAVFPNPKMFIAPGMFGRLKVPSSKEHEVVMIPGIAVTRDQSVEFVYAVDKNNVVERRDIKLGPTACGLRIVRKGLNGEETIITEGIQSVRPGVTVEPTLETISPDSSQCGGADN